MPRLSNIRFNENTVKTSKPKNKVYELRDSGLQGLILRIQPTGKKTWRVALDRITRRNVGDANLLTLGQAKTKAKKMQSDHADGKKIESKRNQCPTLQKFLKGKYRDFVKANHKPGSTDVERLLSACEPLLKTRLDKLSEFQIEKWKAGRLKTAKPNTVKRDLGSNPRVTVTASYAKSNETRHVPLNSEAVTVLKKWKAQGTSSDWVFPSPKTGHRMQDLKKSWSFLLVKADIEDFRFHDLRHDFASRLVMAGIDLYRVKDLLGHSTIQVTEKYTHLAPAALAEAVEVLSHG